MLIFKGHIKSTGEQVFYKLNKRNKAELSLLEVALSRVLGFFLMPYLSPKYNLVKRNNRIIGVACTHICYSASQKEGLDKNFCEVKYDPSTGFTFDSKQRKDPKEIPTYFLNEFPSGFFADLYKNSEAQGDVVFDMDSLASVLCTAYSLEEDDLHKGNIGFYIAERAGVKTVVFFKIDNDLVMADSVMSHYESRIVNWRHGENAFKITARDLINFPKLQDSKNHYWPTSKRYVVRPTDPKAYTSAADIEAFCQLANNPQFIQAKWRAWFKHILIESAMIKEQLAESLEQSDPYERAQIALITQASTARIARLKAVLFSLPQFRDYVTSLDNEAGKELVAEISRQSTSVLSETIISEVTQKINHFKNLCQTSFDKDDTPLHAAIRLGDYRYDQTWRELKAFSNTSNSRGEKPLDLVVQLARNALQNGPTRFDDVRKDPFFIMNHLLNEGVDKTKSYKAFKREYPNLKLISYRFKTDYLDKAQKAKDAEELISILRDVGEDHRFTLKMQKRVSVFCLKFFLKNKNKEPDEALVATIDSLKLALNGNAIKPPRPELQFIRQLRSTLWIVRFIRGLIGGTTTKVELNSILDGAKQNISSSSSCCLPSFFSRKKEKAAESIEKSPDVSGHGLN